MAKKRAAKICLLAVLIAAALFMLAPIVLMALNSFKTSAEMAGNSWGLPKLWTAGNYRDLFAFNSGIMARTFVNSVFISSAYTALTLLVANLAAYVFSKLKFPGSEIVFVALLVTMMIPREITMPAIYLMFSKAKLLNTYTIQIWPGVANVFCLFMIRQYTVTTYAAD